MIEQDTVRLLRECDAGVKMGVASIDSVLRHVHASALRHRLDRCKADHESLDRSLQVLLSRCHDGGKDPNPMAKGMSQAKTGWKLTLDPSDAAIADLMTDGCNMGVKSLSKYLNQYKAADPDSKRIARQLIALEEQLATDIRAYL